MSDELIDGRSLRDHRRPPEPDESPDGPTPPANGDPPRRKRKPRRGDDEEARGLLEETPFAFDPGTGTHSYVVLEPPGEAGDVVRQQMSDATRPGDLPPVPSVTSTEPPPAEPPPPPATPARPTPPMPGSPPAEPPPQPIMKLPRVKIEEEEEEPAPEPPAAPPADSAPQPPPPAPAPPLPDFVPHFHTPTGELPPVPDEEAALGGHTPQVLRPVGEGEEPAPSADAGIPAPLVKIGGTQQRATPSTGMAPPPIPETSSAETSLNIEGRTEEIVDADWVMEVGGRLHQPSPPRAAAADEPSTLVQAIRRSSRWLLPLVALALIVAALIFVPRSLPSFGDGDKPDAETGAAAATANALTLQAIAWTPTPVPPTSTPLPPQAQGRIAYASNAAGPDYDLYVLDMRAGAQRALTADGFNDRSPAWSPDGTRLVFVSDRDGSDDLWVIDTQGGEAAHITSSPDADHFPAWSPDGSLILFSREAPTGSSLMALPTACLDQPATCEGLLRAITSERYDRYPAFAPGGGQLAFAAGTIAGEPTVIALMNVDGSNYSPLAGTGSSDFGPAWSPDGLRIAFVSYALGDQDLWIMSFTGRDLVQITSGAATDVGPSWSPDGSLIVFASDRGEGGSFDLYAMRADCSTPGEGCEENALHLTDDPADELDPAWTP